MGMKAITPAILWEGLPDFLQEGEQLVKKIGGVFAFDVKNGPGGKTARWVVDVKNGKGSVSNDPGKHQNDHHSVPAPPL